MKRKREDEDYRKSKRCNFNHIKEIVEKLKSIKFIINNLKDQIKEIEDAIDEKWQKKTKKNSSAAQQGCRVLVDLMTTGVVNQTPAHGEHPAKGSGQGTEAEG